MVHIPHARSPDARLGRVLGVAVGRSAGLGAVEDQAGGGLADKSEERPALDVAICLHACMCAVPPGKPAKPQGGGGGTFQDTQNVVWSAFCFHFSLLVFLFLCFFLLLLLSLSRSLFFWFLFFPVLLLIDICISFAWSFSFSLSLLLCPLLLIFSFSPKAVFPFLLWLFFLFRFALPLSLSLPLSHPPFTPQQ